MADDALTKILEVFHQKGADGKPRYPAEQRRAFIPLIVLSLDLPLSEYGEEVETAMMEFTLRLGVTPQSTEEEIVAATEAHFAENPLEPNLLEQFNQVLEALDDEDGDALELNPSSIGQKLAAVLTAPPSRHVPIRQKNIFGDDSGEA